MLNAKSTKRFKAAGESRTTFTKSLFKQFLPSNWRLVPMGEVLTSSEYGLSEPGDSSGNTPIVGMRDLSNGRVNLRNLATVDDGGADWSSMRLRAGDILLNRTNSPDLVGKVGIVRQDADAVFASYLVRLKIDPRKANPEFVNYWLNGSIAQKALKRLSTRGVSQANINPTEFRKHCPIPLAPLVEQQKIVEILRTWDEAGEMLDGLIRKAEQREQALTRGLVFGTLRLPDFTTSDEMASHRWFMLPASWDCKPLGALAQEISERNADSDQHEVLSCSKYDGFVRSLDYFKKQVFSADLAGYKKIWRGDFGFPSNHIEEGSIGLQNISDVGLVSPIYTVFRFSPAKIDNGYAYAVLKTATYRHVFQTSTSSSVDRRGSLRWSEFSKIVFPVPSLPEQQAIVRVLNTHARNLEMLRAERDALYRQKQGLMQKLLIGEWRVEIEKTVRAAE